MDILSDNKMGTVILIHLVSGQVIIGQVPEEPHEPHYVCVNKPMVVVMSVDPMSGQARCNLAPFNPFAVVDRKRYDIPEAAVLYSELEANIRTKEIVDAYKSAVTGIVCASGSDLSKLGIQK